MYNLDKFMKELETRNPAQPGFETPFSASSDWRDTQNGSTARAVGVSASASFNGGGAELET